MNLSWATENSIDQRTIQFSKIDMERNRLKSILNKDKFFSESKKYSILRN